MKDMDIWVALNDLHTTVRERKIQRVARARAKEDKLQLKSAEQWKRYLEQLGRKDSNETVR